MIRYQLPRWRYRFMLFALLLAAIAIIWRVMSLQVLPDLDKGYEFLQGQGDSRALRYEQIDAYRGAIYDRSGQPLALSTALKTLWANPKVLSQQKNAIPQLAALLGVTSSHLEQKITNYRNKEFMYLKRGMTPADAAEVMALSIPGVMQRNEYRRFYPAAEILAQTLGYTNVDEQGIEGIELAFDDILKGSPGRLKVMKDRKRNVVDQLGVVTPVTPGRDLTLSIDMELQYYAYRELKSAMTAHKADAAAMVILDAKNGDVLSMVSLPSFNPNDRNRVDTAAMRNRAVGDLIEPGSTVKPFTMLAALESGLYDANSMIDTSPGYIRVSGKLLEDSKDNGELSLTSILAKSSQVGTIKVALSLDADDMLNMMQRVGFGRSVGIGLPGEVSGRLPDSFQWSDLDVAAMSFGHGMSASALQIAKAYTVFANQGELIEPRLLLNEQPEIRERVVQAENANQVLLMMQEAVENGTGKRAKIKNYSVAGKTGTAHLVGVNGYEAHKYMSVFAGISPASNPEFIAVVTIRNPTMGDYYGGVVVGPVFSKVVGYALQRRQIAADLPANGDRLLAMRGGR